MERSQSNAPSEEILSGQRFGGYQLGRLLDVGGTAAVYEAVDITDRRPVAIKILLKSAIGSPQEKGFLHEAKVATGIRHPNVVQVHEVGLEGARPYLVMERLSGESLESRLSRQSALSQSEALEIIIPIAAGLRVVHSAGIVHRDVKPANLMLSPGPDGIVLPKLVDFGASKILPAEKSRTSTFTGTPEYMPLEQLREEAIDGRADQYALAVVLYECLSGRRPYPSAPFFELAQLVAVGEYAQLAELRPELPLELSGVVSRALSVDAEFRFPSITEFAQSLLPFADEELRLRYESEFASPEPVFPRAQAEAPLAIASSKDEPHLEPPAAHPSPKEEPPPRPPGDHPVAAKRSRSTWMAAMLAVLALLLLLTASTLLRRGRPSSFTRSVPAPPSPSAPASATTTAPLEPRAIEPSAQPTSPAMSPPATETQPALKPSARPQRPRKTLQPDREATTDGPAEILLER